MSESSFQIRPDYTYLCPLKRIVETMEIAIIGGGAAGFFLAVNLKTFAPQVEVTVFERQADVLKKYWSRAADAAT